MSRWALRQPWKWQSGGGGAKLLPYWGRGRGGARVFDKVVGGKIAKMSRYCCASHKFLPQPWKSRSGGVGGGGGGGGGLRHIFPDFKNLSTNIHNGVGVLSWPWSTAELTTQKTNKQKQTSWGGNLPPPPPRPPWRRHWVGILSSPYVAELRSKKKRWKNAENAKRQKTIGRARGNCPPCHPQTTKCNACSLIHTLIITLDYINHFIHNTTHIINSSHHRQFLLLA